MQGKHKTNERFFKKYWIAFILIFFLVIGSYFPKIHYFNYSIDTERMIRFPEDTLNWWVQLGRYGLVALSKVPFFGEGIHIKYINILTYVLLFISALVLTYVFDPRTKRSSLQQFLSIGLYVTTPVVLEQTNFVLQSSPVVFSTILLFIGYGLLKQFTKNQKYLLMILGLLLVTLSFTVYVSLVIGFIALTIVDLCYHSRIEHWNLKKYFFRAFYFAGACIVSYTTYLIGNLVSLNVFGLKPSNYLSESKLWGVVSNRQVIETIKSSLITNFKISSPFVFWGSIVLLILFVLLSITNKNNLIITAISFISIVFLSIYTVPLLGYFGTLRSYFPVYPILLYGVAMIIFSSKKNLSIKSFSYLFIFLLVGLQSFNTIKFGVNENKIYQQEVNLVSEIKVKLHEKGIHDFANYKLAIVGGKTFEEITHGDMLGNTVFAWDLSSNVGASYRAGDFIYNHGLKFKRISPKEYQKTLNNIADTAPFPDNRCIKTNNNILIIRLN